MADGPTPETVRARQFDMARKGYERSQVDAFLAEVATPIADLFPQLVVPGAAARTASWMDSPSFTTTTTSVIGGPATDLTLPDSVS